MNKEIVIDIVIGAAATLVLYYLWKEHAAPNPDAGLTPDAVQTSTDMSTDQPGTSSSWLDIFAPGVID